MSTIRHDPTASIARASVAHCRLRSIGYLLLDQYRTDPPPTSHDEG
jgi:hypothetical protein